MNHKLYRAALAALLFAASPAFAQDSGGSTAGHFETTPGPRGVTRWVPDSDRRGDQSRAARSRFARGADDHRDMMNDCMAMACCQSMPMMGAGRPRGS